MNTNWLANINTGVRTNLCWLVETVFLLTHTGQQKDDTQISGVTQQSRIRSTAELTDGRRRVPGQFCCYGSMELL